MKKIVSHLIFLFVAFHFSFLSVQAQDNYGELKTQKIEKMRLPHVHYQNKKYIFEDKKYISGLTGKMVQGYLADALETKSTTSSRKEHKFAVHQQTLTNAFKNLLTQKNKDELKIQLKDRVSTPD